MPRQMKRCNHLTLREAVSLHRTSEPLIDQPIRSVPVKTILLLEETSQLITAMFKLVEAVFRKLPQVPLGWAPKLGRGSWETMLLHRLSP
jgi:hypothetical protein